MASSARVPVYPGRGGGGGSSIFPPRQALSESLKSQALFKTSRFQATAGHRRGGGSRRGRAPLAASEVTWAGRAAPGQGPASPRRPPCTPLVVKEVILASARVYRVSLKIRGQVKVSKGIERALPQRESCVYRGEKVQGRESDSDKSRIFCHPARYSNITKWCRDVMLLSAVDIKCYPASEWRSRCSRFARRLNFAL